MPVFGLSEEVGEPQEKKKRQFHTAQIYYVASKGSFF